MGRERVFLVFLLYNLLHLTFFAFASGEKESDYTGIAAKVGLWTYEEPIDVKEFSDFTLPSINTHDDETAIRDQKGKVVILTFWATWCPYCKEAMPTLQKLWDEFKSENFTILAVSSSEDENLVRDFISKTAYTYPILIDSEGLITKKFRVNKLPATYLLDSKLRVIGGVTGSIDWSTGPVYELIDILKR